MNQTRINRLLIAIPAILALFVGDFIDFANKYINNFIIVFVVALVLTLLIKFVETKIKK